MSNILGGGIFIFINFYKSKSRNFGAFRQVSATTMRVINPPKMTDHCKPINRAAKPDSKVPNSLEEPINKPLTDPTRPRMSSGVYFGTIMPRITILTLSNAPVNANATNDKKKLEDKAKTNVAAPKPATDHNKMRPAPFVGCHRVIAQPIKNAPIAGAARSQP